jgi:uncharacterized Zn finger protein
MQTVIERCPECGGGPVHPLSWERTSRGVLAVESRCDNCGHVAETPPEERRVVETV